MFNVVLPPGRPDQSERDWWYRFFSLKDWPTELHPLFAALFGLQWGIVVCQTEEILPEILHIYLAAYRNKLRACLEQRFPGSAGLIDASVGELRAARGTLPQFRDFDRVRSSLCGLYAYWHYSRDVIGRNGLSRPPLRRQFGSFSRYGGDHRDLLLRVAHPCPLCSGPGELATSSVVVYEGTVAEYHCARCGHRESVEPSMFRPRSNNDELPTRAKCSCATCKKIVAKDADELYPLSQRLPSILGTWVRSCAVSEEQRVLSVRPRRNRPVSPVAAAAVKSLTQGTNPLRAVSDALSRFPVPAPGVHDAVNLVLDELHQAGYLTCSIQHLVNFDNPLTVLRQTFALDQLISPKRRSSFRLLQIEDGYRQGNLGSFLRWIGAVRALGLSSNRFPLPSIFGYARSTLE